jgi:hypothetical protein
MKTSKDSLPADKSSLARKKSARREDFITDASHIAPAKEYELPVRCAASVSMISAAEPALMPPH